MNRFKIDGLDFIFFFYFFCTLFVGGASLVSGHLPAGCPFPDFRFSNVSLFLNLILVLGSYFFVFMLYRIVKTKIDLKESEVEGEKAIAIFTLLCQLIFLHSVVTEGVFSAGLASKRGGGLIGYFSMIFVPDFLFMTYYSFAKRSSLSFANASVYFISTLLRGWGSGLLVIVFIKLAKELNKKTLKYFFLIFFICGLIGPLLYQMRSTVRGRGSFNVNNSGELLAEAFVKAYFSSDSESTFLNFILTVVNRFSHLPSTVVVTDNLDLFWLGVWEERFAPAFSEGKVQQYLTGKRFLLLPELSIYLCYSLLPTPLGPWYIDPGLISWFWINPFLFPATFGYFFVTILLGCYLMIKIKAGTDGIKGIFLFSLLFSINGWYVPFSNCIQAVAIFWVLNRLKRMFFFNVKELSFFKRSIRNRKFINTKRIAFFLVSLNGGGAERVIVTLANQLVSQNIPVDLVVGNAFGPYLKEVTGKVNIIDLKENRALLCFLPLIKYLMEAKPRVIFSTMNYLNVLVLAANFVAGFPSRVVVREAATFSANIKTTGKIMKMILPKLMKLLYPLADRVVAVSNGVKTDLVASLKLNSDSIKVIYNPVGYTELLERSEEQVSHKWFEKVDNEKEPVILAVGRFSPEKDYETLLRAFAKVCQKRAARLIILGEGPTKEATRLLAQELKIEDFVDFPGFISNPFPYMKKANVFVLSSNQEGMPNSLLQATILGTQIVSTDCKSGPAEILENGKYGILVPVGDSERLAEAILKKFDEPKNDVEQTLIEKYDSKRIALQYLKAADYCCD